MGQGWEASSLHAGNSLCPKDEGDGCATVHRAWGAAGTVLGASYVCVCKARWPENEGRQMRDGRERERMENERDISRNASSPDAISQVGFCSGS